MIFSKDFCFLQKVKDKEPCCFRGVICRTPWSFLNQTRHAFFACLQCFRHVQRRACVIAHLICWRLAIPEKIQTVGGWGWSWLMIYLFEKPPGIFHFHTLPLDIPQNCVRSLGNLTLFFLGHPWKFHFVFN